MPKAGLILIGIIKQIIINFNEASFGGFIFFWILKSERLQGLRDFDFVDFRYHPIEITALEQGGMRLYFKTIKAKFYRS